jgi:hypothetical protein
MKEIMKKLVAFGVLISMVLITGCYYGPCMSGSGQIITEERDIAGFTEVISGGDFEVYVNQADEFSVEVVAYENLLPIIETYISGNSLIIETKNNSCYKSGQPIKVYVSLPELELLELNGSGKLIAGVTEGEYLECGNNGSGYLSVDTVYMDYFYLSNSGSGHIEVERIYSDEVSLVQSGSGTIDTGEVSEPEEVTIKHSSSGNIRSIVVGGLNVNAILSGSGRIDLSGDVQKVDYTLNASGRIDALDLMSYDARTTSSGSGTIFVWATEYLEATVSGSGDILYRGEPQTSFRVTGSGSIRPY